MIVEDRIIDETDIHPSVTVTYDELQGMFERTCRTFFIARPKEYFRKDEEDGEYCEFSVQRNWELYQQCARDFYHIRKGE